MALIFLVHVYFWSTDAFEVIPVLASVVVAVNVIVISPVKRLVLPKVAFLATLNTKLPFELLVPAVLELTVTPLGNVPTVAITGTLVIP